MLQNCQNATHPERKPCFEGVLDFHLHIIFTSFSKFFCVAVKIAFFCDFCRFGPPKGFLFGSTFAEFADFARIKSMLKLRLEKKMTFGRLFAGAGGMGRGGACLAMQILQN